LFPYVSEQKKTFFHKKNKTKLFWPHEMGLHINYVRVALFIAST
jgi:hypothetical protein